MNSVTTNFAYRGDGLRDSRTVSGGATTTFTWDIASGLPVVLDDGNQYVYGAGLTSMKQSGNWYYYLADGLGSTMAVVDASGVVQDSYTYDVYGKPTKTGSLSNEFDFAGQQTDGTGLQYLRARYYDPATGVFLSREPLAHASGWLGNTHAYATGSPVRFQDPTGLMAVESEGVGVGSTTGPIWLQDGMWWEERDAGFFMCTMIETYAGGMSPECVKYDPDRTPMDVCGDICRALSNAPLAAVTFTIGEYKFSGTQLFRDRMRAYQWDKAKLDEIKTGTRYRDKFGRTVWTKARPDGGTDIYVESPGEFGHMVRQNADINEMRLMREEFQWVLR